MPPSEPTVVIITAKDAAAIAASRAPVVCVLDADDYMAEGRLKRLSAAAPGGWDLLVDDLILAAFYRALCEIAREAAAGAPLGRMQDQIRSVRDRLALREQNPQSGRAARLRP